MIFWNEISGSGIIPWRLKGGQGRRSWCDEEKEDKKMDQGSEVEGSNKKLVGKNQSGGCGTKEDYTLHA